MDPESEIFDSDELDELDEQESRQRPLLPLALGIAGMLFGLIGIIMGYTAGKDVKAINQAGAELPAFVDQMRGYETKMAELTAENERLRGLTESMRREMEGYLDQYRDAINVNRQRINTNQSNILKLSEGKAVGITEASELSSIAPTSSTSTRNNSSENTGLKPVENAVPVNLSGDNTPRTVETGDGSLTIHKIAPNDTFTSLAKRYGTSVDAIERANTSLNPNRLQIGDEVKIPQ